MEDMMGLIGNRDAQFMLLAGFIIGIGLVITTVMLNSVIFEGNMAVGAGTEPSKNDLINLIQITNDETRAAYRSATNGSASNDSMIIANFTRQTQNFRDNLSTLYALHGEGVNLSWNVSNWNDSIYPYFTDNGSANGVKNWTVMESVKNVSKFELMNVTGTDFEVNITNQTTGGFLWSMTLTGSNNIIIKSANYPPKPHYVNYAYIYLLNSTYNLTTSVGNNISKVSFINGTSASGRFNFTGNTSYSRNFTRARDYILYANETFSTSRMRADFTIPISVPW
jgi:hypothetical protein